MTETQQGDSPQISSATGVCQKHAYEIESHYQQRKAIFDKIYQESGSESKAESLSQVWYNMKEGGCHYQPAVEEELRRYEKTRE